MRDDALWVGGLDLVGAQVVERELVPHVAEEVLLPPAREHPVGHREQRQLVVGRDNRGLMAVVGQATDLAHLQPVG